MKKHLWWILSLAILAGGAVMWQIIGPVSAKDAARFGGQCERWISKEFGEGRDARVKDSWRKRGNLVFEVLVARENSGTMDVYLCVVDKAAGTMQKPSAFDQSWR